MQQVQMPQNCCKMTRMLRNTAVARKKKAVNHFKFCCEAAKHKIFMPLLNIVFCVSVKALLQPAMRRDTGHLRAKIRKIRVKPCVIVRRVRGTRTFFPPRRSPVDTRRQKLTCTFYSTATARNLSRRCNRKEQVQCKYVQVRVA